jgi:hypothetical protein
MFEAQPSAAGDAFLASALETTQLIEHLKNPFQRSWPEASRPMATLLSSRFPLAAQRGVAGTISFASIIQAAHQHPIQPGVER